MSPTPPLRRRLGLSLALLLFQGHVLAADAGLEASRYYEDALARFERNDAAGAIVQLKNALQQDKRLLPAHVLLARAYLKQGQPAAAESALDKAVSLGVDRSEIAALQAQAYFEQGKYKELLERVSLDGLPPASRQEVLLTRSYAQMEMGDFIGAQSTLQQAAESAPRSAVLLVAQATLKMQMGYPAQAGDLARQALAINPREARAWNLVASADHLGGDWQAALNGYAKAIEFAPNLAEARLARVSLLLERGRLDEASRDLEVIRTRHPTDPRGSYLQAAYLSMRGDANGSKAKLLETAKLLDAYSPEAVTRRGQLLMLGALTQHGLKNYQRAKVYLENYLQKYPRDAGARKLQGSIYLQDGNLDGAVTTLERAYREAPRDPKVLTLLAAAYSAKKQPARAAALLEEAASGGVQSADLSAALGYSLIGVGRKDAGLDHLSRAYRMQPGDPQLGTALAMLYIRRGQPRQAVQIAEALARRAADNPAAFNLLGVTRAAAGDRKGSRTAYEKALSIDPKLSAARLNLGKLETLEGRYAAARKQYAQLLQETPHHTQALYEMARTEEAAGRPREAVAWMQKLLARDARNVDAALYLAELLLRVGDADMAADVASQAVALNPDHLPALSVLGRASAAAGRPDAAKVAFNRMAKQARFDVAQLVDVARLQMSVSDLEGAVLTLNKALSTDPGALSANLLLARIELARQSYDKAEQRARQMAGANPRSAAAQGLLGEVLMARGRRAEAVQAFEAAMRLEDSAANAIGLYRALFGAGESRRALAMMDDWSRRHPGLPTAELALAEGYLRAGDLGRARSLYEAYLRRHGEEAGVLNNLANILMRQRDAGALGYAERAYRLAPGDYAVNDTLGWLLLQKGQTDRALRYLREARLRAPQAPEVRYHLAAALHRAGRDGEARRELQDVLRSPAGFEGRAEAEQLLKSLK